MGAYSTFLYKRARYTHKEEYLENLNELTEKLAWDFSNPESACVINDDENFRPFTRQELETIVAEGPMTVWMGCYSVDSYLEVSSTKGELITFQMLLDSMKEFLSRDLTLEETEFFHEKIFPKNRPRQSDKLRVCDTYLDTCFFEGPMSVLQQDYKTSTGRIVRAGTYGFEIGS